MALLAVLTSGPAAVGQTTPSPAAVSNAGAAWDAASRRVLVYGGMRDRGLHADSALWAWDGDRWQALGDGAPGARSGAILATDTRRHRVLLFGGQNSAEQFEDIWAWEGGRWSRLAPTGPGSRHMAAGTFDPQHDQLVVFGGYSVERKAMLGDTWVWNGSTWRRSAGPGPAARAGHVMGYDSARNRIILMGGADAEGRRYSDTWSWDGSGWSRIGDGPEITPNSQLVPLPQGGLGVFGGWDGRAPSRALFHWHGGTWRSMVDQAGPPARMEASIAFDPVRKQLVLFGGSNANGAKLSDLWEYDGSSWRRRDHD